MSIKESGDTVPFSPLLRRGPFRLPAVLLCLGMFIIVVGAPAFDAVLNLRGVMSFAPLAVAGCGFGLVATCAQVANDQRGGHGLLYVFVIATLSLAVWLAVDDFNRRHERGFVEQRLGADLSALCHRAGGQSLLDPICADYLRVLDDYRYPHGIPAFTFELRRQALGDGDNPRE